MKQLVVDFNSTHDGLLRALQSDASAPLRVGEVVRLTDDEEHVARGRVDRLEGPLAYVVVDWDTWATVSHLTLRGALYSSAAAVTGQQEAATYRTREHFVGAGGGAWKNAVPNKGDAKGGTLQRPKLLTTA